MLNGFRDHIQKIKDSNAEFVVDIQKRGGINQHLRALAAQLLLWVFFHSIIVYISPLKDTLSSNLFSLAILLALSVIYGLAKERAPTWIGDYLKGNFFYECSLKDLNKFIIILVLINCFIIVPHHKKLYGR